MPIVIYKCDVCKREKEFQQNVNGLETPQRCVITHGCRGKLFFKQVLADFVRGKPPEDVSGLDNWQQRRVLYNHKQTIERDEWTIQHNLGNSVDVSIYVSMPTESDPDNIGEIEPLQIIIDDANNIRVLFDRPWAGAAQIIARSSDPQILQTAVTVVETEQLQQFSTNGIITVATKVPVGGIESVIQLRLTFKTPQETEPVKDYTITDLTSSDSPWNVDGTTVVTAVFNNNLYVIRSFDGVNDDITSGVIGNGSTFTISAIDDNNDSTFRSIDTDEVFILLANAPYTTSDKILDKVVDVTDADESSNQFALSYDTNEFYVVDSTIQTVYPHIYTTT